MIQKSDILVVVLEHTKVNRNLASWVRQFPLRQIASPSTGLQDYVALWRNQICARFLAEKAKPNWLMMVDDDMVPIPGTESLLTSEADVAGADYISPDNGKIAYGAQGLIGPAAMKISRRALESVKPPWFWPQTSPDGMSIVKCECTHSRGRLCHTATSPFHASVRSSSQVGRAT